MQVSIPADSTNTKNILDLLENMGYSLPCNCHGNHHCKGDNYSFDCALVPKKPITITLPSPAATDIHSIALEGMTPVAGFGDTMLIDIGTSTIAMALIEKSTGTLRQITTFSNPQRSFGTDVISRIQASVKGHSSVLKHCLTDALLKQAQSLCDKNHQTLSDISHCYIAGNTVMIHTLMGYDCHCLAQSPFHIEKESPANLYYHSCEVTIIPWQAPFVGGDITAGIFACPILNQTKPSLFMDLGTNGEMVLFHHNTLYMSATAVGPALEGGGLTFGMPAIKGAIKQVKLKSHQHQLATIDNTFPIGICGSGAISLCAELLRHGYVSKDSVLTDKFPRTGFPLCKTPNGTTLLFTPEDFRNVQLAIAAIAAGIDTLCREANILPEDVSQIFLAGGFGFSLEKEDGTLLQLFSTLCPSRIHTMGNTCLQGLYLFATTNIKPKLSFSKEIVSFAEHPYFKERFLSHLVYSSK